ncbi:CRISPR-associated helicase/endonuclease Cas3 [Cellvibrio fontiphilus]|uniref:CRISPR-associated helicase/endonuclease Cas3 n=1 Tax=Cellvibrio fontiphilus TaxID=1815559 RepID=A0ABV7FHA3_9GAMM
MESYFQYWGKAKKDPQAEGPDYHLLPYHCLDVAAVGEVWWNNSQVIRNSFLQVTGLNEAQTKAWVLFFIALHDYGKFDVRFQLKAPRAWEQVNSAMSGLNAGLNQKKINQYYHGPAGVYWFYQDLEERFKSDGRFGDNEDWAAWISWFAPVAGHHGAIPAASESNDDGYALPVSCDTSIVDSLMSARLEWLRLLEAIFLIPAGLSLADNPPEIKTSRGYENSQTMLAGFCAVCDWIGSSDFFPYNSVPINEISTLKTWYQKRLKLASDALYAAGVISQIKPDPSISKLLDGYQPRQIQCLVKGLRVAQSLTLVEASTGSGKTETALAYAWELLALGLADSIIFALPTQATSNAMLKRLELAAPILFDNTVNVILAHGRASYQDNFIRLKEAVIPQTVQAADEALVQCGQWLAQSRKRVFLGQIGVCTIDQVLVSVLPIKHKFVRGFGVGRSVLIVDEVHAYDSYMYGLLTGVLQQQRLAGGSAILLSATLPAHQKKQLTEAWGSSFDESEKSYPLITQCVSAETSYFNLEELPGQQPQETQVHIELIEDENMFSNSLLDQRMLDAVRSGAQVCLICNLVDVAQNTYQRLLALIKQIPDLDVSQIDIFHSRFVFADRQVKEKRVVDLFGKKPDPEDARAKGHLLIATQVVEQSLDVDFDWLITQLCPVDLLFQRMGRLHRHSRSRPSGFEKALCSVLVPTSIDYQLHALIYGNSRVLWRTHKLLEQAVFEQNSILSFPTIYRDWIEPVYHEDVWPNEPAEIIKSYDEYLKQAKASCYTAKFNMNRSFSMDDTDGNAALLTRDGEMGLNLVPYFLNAKGKRSLINGLVVDELHASEKFEKINLNTVSVPASWWRKKTELPQPDELGLIWLEFKKSNNELTTVFGEWCYNYHSTTGLQRKAINEKDAI